MSTDPDEAISIAAAAALLLAAITMRDLANAMHPKVYAAMPADMKNRVTTSEYQASFDALPPGIQAAARKLVNANPDVVEARRIDVQQ